VVNPAADHEVEVEVEEFKKSLPKLSRQRPADQRRRVRGATTPADLTAQRVQCGAVEAFPGVRACGDDQQGGCRGASAAVRLLVAIPLRNTTGSWPIAP
jgi:hypothetical protein